MKIAKFNTSKITLRYMQSLIKTLIPSIQVDTSTSHLFYVSPYFLSLPLFDLFPPSPVICWHILITSSNSNLLCCKLVHVFSHLKFVIYPLAFHSTAFLNRNGKRRSWKVKFVSIVITCQPCINGLVQTYELGGRGLLENGIAHINSNGCWVVCG